MRGTPHIRIRDKRAAERFDATMPVVVAGAPGLTHNISAQGVYFETDAEQRVGALVNFTIEYSLYGRKRRLLCEGKVVRVEKQNGRIGVAARLVAPFFEDPAPGA
jgi:PilZ domain